MAEGGNAEKFPDEWDIQFLGNTVASQLASGTSPDFLIRRYVFSIFFLFYWLNLTTEVPNFFYIYEIPVNFLSGFFFLTSPDKLF